VPLAEILVQCGCCSGLVGRITFGRDQGLIVRILLDFRSLVEFVAGALDRVVGVLRHFVCLIPKVVASVI